MLVLSRRREEAIQFVVPPSAEPTVFNMKVFEVAKSVVRFGFDAPRTVIITRTELLKQPDTTPAATEETQDNKEIIKAV